MSGVWANNRHRVGGHDAAGPSPGRRRHEHYQTVGGGRIQTASLGRALAQPDGAVRTAALQSVASKWLSIDPPAATKWFNALPDDPQKSQILSGVVKRVIYGDEWGKVGTDESLALQMSSHLLPNIPGFISALDDPKKKAEAYEAFAGIWLRLINEPRRPGSIPRPCRRPLRIAFCARRPPRRNRRKRCPKRTVRRRSVTLLRPMNRERRPPRPTTSRRHGADLGLWPTLIASFGDPSRGSRRRVGS